MPFTVHEQIKKKGVKKGVSNIIVLSRLMSFLTHISTLHAYTLPRELLLHYPRTGQISTMPGSAA